MNRKKITALLLSTMMAVTPAVPAAANVTDEVIGGAYETTEIVLAATDDSETTIDILPVIPAKKSGWETVGKVRYYYLNGKKVTGLKKIGTKTYYFDKSGKLVTNKNYCKIGKKYYKIDAKGQATALSQVETMAAIRLQACDGNLKKAFNWSTGLKYEARVSVSKKTPTEYGKYGFTRQTGDCYVMASTFYWMAKVAGYDAHYVKGYFQKSNGKGAHAWVEIDQKVNGKTKTYVYDPNFQKEYKLNGYKLTYGAKKTLKYINYKRVN